MFALTFSLPAANAQQESQPDLAFLEYLAELENVDGQWMDALDVAKSAEGALSAEDSRSAEGSSAKGSMSAEGSRSAEGSQTTESAEKSAEQAVMPSGSASKEMQR